MSINHVFLIETLSNSIQGFTSALGTTYSRITTGIDGYKSRSQKDRDRNLVFKFARHGI
jgi:hypothetical protein